MAQFFWFFRRQKDEVKDKEKRLSIREQDTSFNRKERKCTGVGNFVASMVGKSGSSH